MGTCLPGGNALLLYLDSGKKTSRSLQSYDCTKKKWEAKTTKSSATDSVCEIMNLYVGNVFIEMFL